METTVTSFIKSEGKVPPKTFQYWFPKYLGLFLSVVFLTRYSSLTGSMWIFTLGFRFSSGLEPLSKDSLCAEMT